MKIKFLLIILPLLSADSSPLAVSHHEPSVARTEAIYIINHGWHTGFVIPASSIQTQIPKLKDRFPNTPYLEIGWGDKGFYQADEITVGLALQAMFWSSGSVIHAVAVPEWVTNYFSHAKVEKLCLTAAEYAALIQFIADSFYKNASRQIVALTTGRYGDSQFYEANGTYHLMNTCNKWTAQGLQHAGIDIDPVFKLTASSVMSAVEADDKECAFQAGGHISSDACFCL
jgi:uncharacterized protein (TIGR02117 family)